MTSTDARTHASNGTAPMSGTVEMETGNGCDARLRRGPRQGVLHEPRLAMLALWDPTSGTPSRPFERASGSSQRFSILAPTVGTSTA